MVLPGTNQALTDGQAKRALTATQVAVAALNEHGVRWIAPSLYMQIRPQGTRSWLFRYGRNGENQWLGLGAVADKSLSETRDEAAQLRSLVRRGGEPRAKFGTEHLAARR